MKLQSKILILLSITFGVVILIFLSYQFIRIYEKKLFYVETKKNQELVIDKVLQLNRIKYEQLISDNSGWDEMVSFAIKPDSAWAKDNVDFFVNSFKLTFVQVFNKQMAPIYNYGDSVCLMHWECPGPDKIESFFSDTAFVHYFQVCDNDLLEIFGATVVPADDTDTRKTAPQGYIFIAKKWNANYVAEHSQATNYRAELVFKSDLPNFKQDQKRVYFTKYILNQNGEAVAALLFSTKDMLKGEMAPFLYLSILLFIAALTAIVVFLFYFRKIILVPLRQISTTLDTHNPEHIRQLKSNTNEFEKLKNLIMKFFVQEELLKKNNADLNNNNATKDKLFSIIAHDLRNPVGNILAISDLLDSSLRNKEYENLTEYAEMIGSQAKETLDLLETLFEWAKSQTGKISFKPEILNLKSTLIQVIEILNPSAKLKDIVIESEISETVQLFADQNMLNTVLRNLITNAIKFTNPSGLIRISAEQKTDCVEITVSDNGIGIDKDTIDSLFHIDLTHTTLGTANEKGTGLGLIICKEFVEKHGGMIQVISLTGKGSKFSCSLPSA
jgi:signal transduction histidine kinase